MLKGFFTAILLTVGCNVGSSRSAWSKAWLAKPRISDGILHNSYLLGGLPCRPNVNVLPHVRKELDFVTCSGFPLLTLFCTFLSSTSLLPDHSLLLFRCLAFQQLGDRGTEVQPKVCSHCWCHGGKKKRCLSILGENVIGLATPVCQAAKPDWRLQFLGSTWPFFVLLLAPRLALKPVLKC